MLSPAPPPHHLLLTATAAHRTGQRCLQHLLVALELQNELKRCRGALDNLFSLSIFLT